MKALIGMSGGVDSSVAAYLMIQNGFSCIGATMRLYTGQDQDNPCCKAEDVEDARAVASRLGIPFHVFDLSREFQENVMEHFVSSYEQGLTPNPCVECNRHLKFDQFLQKAQQLGCEYIVTGHYARITQDSVSGRYLLQKALDATKDQSYFLCRLTQHQLQHTCFPLGNLTKAEARVIAEQCGFLNAKKRDSQDICFVPDGDYMAFLQRYTKKEYPCGNYLDLQGKIVGRHKGAVAYTFGQRKGLNLALGSPVYVCDKDMQQNTVTVGPNEALFHTTLLANDWNWISIDCLTQPLRVMAKARSRMNEQPATVYPDADGAARVVFDEPQRALTPGQAVVLYDGDTVIGGGTITQILQ